MKKHFVNVAIAVAVLCSLLGSAKPAFAALSGEIILRNQSGATIGYVIRMKAGTKTGCIVSKAQERHHFGEIQNVQISFYAETQGTCKETAHNTQTYPYAEPKSVYSAYGTKNMGYIVHVAH